MAKAELIRHLRELTGGLASLERDYWKSPNAGPGVTKGIVVELLGNGRTEWLLELFKANPDHFIYWCERGPAINPVAIHQRGIGLERIKFLNSAGDLQQPLRLALESGHYPFIVAPARFDEVRIFQRFSLLAEKSKSTLFLLADQKFTDAWPISLQLEIHFSGNEFQFNIHRQKYRE